MSGKRRRTNTHLDMALVASLKKTSILHLRRAAESIRSFFLSSRSLLAVSFRFVLFVEREQLRTFISSFVLFYFIFYVFFLFLATFDLATAAKFKAISRVTRDGSRALNFYANRSPRTRTTIIMIEIIARIRSVYVHVIVA